MAVGSVLYVAAEERPEERLLGDLVHLDREIIFVVRRYFILELLQSLVRPEVTLALDFLQLLEQRLLLRLVSCTVRKVFWLLDILFNVVSTELLGFLWLDFG